MNPILHDLQNKQWVWSAANAKQQQQKYRTGFAALDNALHAGFPHSGMLHIHSLLGCGEVRLLLDIIANLPEEQDDQLCVFINPPGDLNAEFLLEHGVDLDHLIIVHKVSQEEALWSAEQCAKSGACRYIFMWQTALSQLQVRKLENAAQHGNCYCIWLDHSKELAQNLPVSLSLSLRRTNEDLDIKVNKQKVGWAAKPINLPFPFRSRLSGRYQNASIHHSSKVVNLHSSHRV